MKLNYFYYDLPKEYIAQDPLDKRDESKLLIIDKKTGELSHKKFYDIIDYLNPGDTLVLNETKVIPARLIGELVDTNKPCEIFLVKRIDKNKWECLVKPGKKLRVNKEVIFGNGKLKAKILDILEDGNRIVDFTYDGIFEEILDSLGETPLPPYITHKLEDKNKYQTVYAKVDGSVAAPTAGLHFTKDLLDKIKNKGVNITKVLLHVSLGTFRPVHEENIEDHNMHSEFINVTKEAADIINDTKDKGKKVVCVGTTSLRTLESSNEFDEKENKYKVIPYSGETNIFIYPGYKFKIVDELITNFHLPESTLIMLVSALAGRENVLNAYEEAKKNNYRFFSFGDACFFKD